MSCEWSLLVIMQDDDLAFISLNKDLRVNPKKYIYTYSRVMCIIYSLENVWHIGFLKYHCHILTDRLPVAPSLVLRNLLDFLRLSSAGRRRQSTGSLLAQGR